ncbi:MAG: hypothetical protein A3K19_16385 [Lentisphaerae bacterium RIFOXYB12_FULL_65_16]|nr:MAG: hypothetical protein A3K18_32815 [Lentisphaerae bacterium RIFOXYA12_64_32]OGV89021.1 MAG: hypothetical protein A3K19_16385 [Lentisphaerae bacterium RIFOXYB12_FULL_65_16]
MSQTTPSWKFECITSWDEVWRPSFVEQWLRWLDESPTGHVFFHPALVRAWVETYQPLRDVRPLFLIGECDGTTAFLPLVLWRRNWKNAWQRLLVPVGYSDFDYHDPIFAGGGGSGNVAVDFWNAVPEYLQSTVRQGFDQLVIDGVRSPAAGQGLGWTEDGACPWSDLTPFKLPEDFLPSLKKSLRGDLRRQQRRIEEAGGLATITYGTHQTAEVLLELPAFLDAHSRRWPNAYKAPHFHENLVRHGLPVGVLSFCMIRIGGEVAAWHLGFSFCKRVYLYMPAMVEQFANLSPGKILMLRLYEHAIAEGKEVFDHLRGAEEYKEDWSTASQALWRFEMRALGAASSIRNSLVSRVKPMLVRR